MSLRLTIFMLILAIPSHLWAWQSVRVAVHRSADKAVITGKEIKIGVITKDGVVGEVVGYDPKRVIVSVSKGLLSISGIQPKLDAVTVNSSDEWLYIDGSRYHAPLEMVADPGAKGGIVVVSEVPLESYIKGVVNSETPSSWPIEALKAQAVAARTFALYQRITSQSRFFHLEATVSDQVYGGAKKFPDSVIKAIEETEGLVLAYNNQPITAFFHSHCGGIGTESSRLAWGNAQPYLPRVKCNCLKYTPRNWSLELTYAEAEKALKAAGLLKGKLKSISIGKQFKSGRNSIIKILGSEGSTDAEVNKFRAALGFARLASPIFTIQKTAKGFSFVGKGAGHGVGMCQWGAFAMAKDGATFDKILGHYYPGAELVKMY